MIPLILACCIDSPKWVNPKLEPQPPVQCSQVAPNADKCTARLVEGFWYYEGETRNGGTFSFMVEDPAYSRWKTEELNQQLEDVLSVPDDEEDAK